MKEVRMEEEKKTKGKQALGKCPYCGSTRKALYEKRWKRWIVIGCYCPVCGLVEWKEKKRKQAERELDEYWKRFEKDLEEVCVKCFYKRHVDEVLEKMKEEKKKLGLM